MAMMRLSEVMSSPVETVAPSATLDEARELMKRRKIHHLVALDGKKVVGVISARDLALPDGVDRTVADRMHDDVVTVDARATVREAANLLRGHAVGCLPILDGNKLVGIITIADMLALIGKGTEKPAETKPRWVLRRRSPKRQRGGSRSPR